MESEADRQPLPTVRSPLWAAAGVTWIDNLGSSAALIGVYFVAEHAHGFSPGRLLLLGLLQGATYIVAAWFAGRFTRRFAGPTRAMSTRSMLAWLHVALFAMALLPIVWRSPASIWVLVGVYAPLTGMLWPMVESFLSAGRTG